MKLTMIFVVLLCCSCSAHYRISKNSVEHVSWNAGHGKVVKKIEGADPKTFEELKPYFGKDKENVFWQASLVVGAESNSFRAINNYYGVDANHGVVNGRIVEGSEGLSFEYIGDNWSKDSRNYYYMGEKLALCDYDTFRIIEDFLSDRAQDNSCYYYQSFRVPVKDPSSLVVLPANYAKDSSQVYWGHLVIEDADPATFEVKDSRFFARDKNQCFSGPSTIECERMTDEGKKYCYCQ